MNRICLFAFLLIIYSCKNKCENCTTTKSLLNADYGDRVFPVSSDSSGALEFRDRGKDSIVAGYYTFYKSGHLKSYDFFISLDTAVYHEEYDTCGNLLKMLGNPFIRASSKFVSSDSIFVKAYFFGMNKLYEDLVVSSLKVKRFKVKFEDDNFYSNMKVARFGLNMNGQSHIKVFLTGEYHIICTGITNSFSDTIDLHHLQ